MKSCPKCNTCNPNDSEKCIKCNYSFSSDNPDNNIAFELINYEKYQKNLAALYPILNNNKPLQFEVHISSVTHEVRFLVNNMKIGSVPQDKAKYFLKKDIECKISNLSISNNKNLFIPRISVICSKKQPESNTNQQSINSNANIQTMSKNTEPPRTNSIATAIRAIAVLTYLCGFIVGLVFFYNESLFQSPFSWIMAVICWVASIIIGTFMIGVSEIIKLLDEIKNKK